MIKKFSIRESWWYIGIKDDGGVKSKGTREITLHKQHVALLFTPPSYLIPTYHQHSRIENVFIPCRAKHLLSMSVLK